MSSNRFAFLAVVCLGLLPQTPSLVSAQSYYFTRDTGDLNAEAGAYSFDFGARDVDPEGPVTVLVDAGAEVFERDDSAQVTITSDAAATLNPDGQSVAEISGTGEASIDQADPDGTLQNGSWSYGTTWGSAAWTFDSDVYERGEGNPYVSGEIDANWSHNDTVGQLTTAGWTVSWNGGQVIRAWFAVQSGEYWVYDADDNVLDYGFVDPTDSISIPFEIPTPDVGDRLEIVFNTGCNIQTEPTDAQGTGQLYWSVTLGETDL